MKLSDQFEDKLRRSMAPFLQEGSVAFASELNRAMHRNVDNGRSFEDDKYDKLYEVRTGRDRRLEGFQSSFVDLQRGRKRVKSSQVRSITDRSAEIFYPDPEAGRIMYEHNFGSWKGGRLPRRLLFPDVTADGRLENANAVPEHIVELVEKMGSEIMNIPV